MGLQFQLPDRDEILTASGETITARRQASTVGVRFTNLPPDSAWAIESFLKAALSRDVSASKAVDAQRLDARHRVRRPKTLCVLAGFA